MTSNHLLRAAAEAGDLHKVRARLDAGDDLELRHKGTGRTPLLEAVIAGHSDVVALLLAKGADAAVSCTAVGHTPLGWAVVQRHPGIVRVLLDHGAAVDAIAPNSFLGRTPLHLAAQLGDVVIIDELLGAGADVSVLDGRGENALLLAREGSHAEAFAALVTAGATEPVLQPALEPLPWPSLTWDPKELGTTPSLPDDAEPAQVVSSYIRALYAWEIEAWQGNKAAIHRGEYHDLGPALDVAERVTAAHVTERVRKYRRASVGAIPDLTPEYVLVETTEPSVSRRELLVRHPNPDEFVHEYEWVFVCLRKKGRWRIDSARNRLHGTSEWSSAVL